MMSNIAESGQDPRPEVGRAVSSRSTWFMVGGLGAGAVLLFSALEARRAATINHSALQTAGEPSSAAISPPPDLAIPGRIPEAVDTYRTTSDPAAVPQIPIVTPPLPLRAHSQRFAPQPPIIRQAPYGEARVSIPQYQMPPVTTPEITRAVAPPTVSARNDGLAGARVEATRLANPASTVPQGAVIQAVLETALDSNRPGFARAIVSRDVRSFDGSVVLIPRGSRLFGEYKADLVDGQNRAFVNWQKLTRPDGVQIALESPAADPLGRAGVKGSVNSHFFQRFGGAILQSVLDIGVGVATRAAAGGNSVILGLPGSTQQISSPILPRQETIHPTLKVAQGSRVSVFVARDLDFSTEQ